MAMPQTILITGCSEGGLGDSLARALHCRGRRVFATARNPAKMAHFEALGIETMTLDVLSPESIAECVKAVAERTNGSLDMLINNSGGGYAMPLMDVDLNAARNLFEVNVFAVLAVTQAFVPLLLKSKCGTVVNNTSTSSILPVPTAGIYNASKAAAAMLTDTLRLELSPFNLKVIELKTGAVRSQFYSNQTGGNKPSIPENSIYNVAKTDVEKVMAGSHVDSRTIEADRWAELVAGDLLKRDPSVRIWRGANAKSIWFARTFLPSMFIEHVLWKLGAMEIVSMNYAGLIKDQ